MRNSYNSGLVNPQIQVVRGPNDYGNYAAQENNKNYAPNMFDQIMSSNGGSPNNG